MSEHDTNWTLIASAASSLTHGSQRLQNFIDALRRLLHENAWKSYTHPNGTHHEFTHFADFIEHPHGLHATPQQVRNLVHDDPQLASELDAALAGQHGGDRRSEDFKSYNVTLENPEGPVEDSKRGNRRAYRLRRLEREAPEHHARVLAGELSVNRAMIESGLQTPTPSIPQGTPVNDVATTLRRRYSPEELATLRQLLLEEDTPE
ncbi:hypothetical protein [Halostreptopolyspora alba]|uniref:Uncharacterized protein n=1 Tax=Halostreptopolyspora alba TaxID=2487137 RepID=A0A3N0DYQ8_9ACTN|nr:hypothetical protein EFW17_22550 [Nocardiopsaceae bacterium YIM 96095]